MQCLPEGRAKKCLYSSSQRLDGQEAGQRESVNIAVAGCTVFSRESVLLSPTQMVSISQVINSQCWCATILGDVSSIVSAAQLFTDKANRPVLTALGCS
jgi:hypothetical protein